MRVSGTIDRLKLLLSLGIAANGAGMVQLLRTKSESGAETWQPIPTDDDWIETL